jgi:hypothetical protein
MRSIGSPGKLAFTIAKWDERPPAEVLVPIDSVRIDPVEQCRAQRPAPHAIGSGPPRRMRAFATPMPGASDGGTSG